MYRFSLFFLVAFLIVGCDAFEGPQGPQGPPGVANIEVIEKAYTSSDAAVNENVAAVNWDVPEITRDVYEDGTVRADFENDTQWLALPWTFSSGSYTLEITYSYGEESFSLLFVSNQSTISRSEIPDGRVKITVVPPTEDTAATTSSAAYKVENLTYSLPGGE